MTSFYTASAESGRNTNSVNARPNAAASPNDEALKAAKRRQWEANRSNRKHGAEQTGLQLEREFLDRRTKDRVWPWLVD